MKMGPQIVQTENTERSIRYLAAQKQLYIIAKRFFALQIILTSVIVTALSFVNMCLDIKPVIAIYSIAITLLDLIFLTDLIKSYKEKAARIQELFDTNTLNIEWNSMVEKTDYEIIYRYSEQHKKIDPQYDDLKNWYSLHIGGINSDVAKIICQRSNFTYDLSLRKYFNLLLILCIGIMCVCILGVAIIIGADMTEYLMIGILPLLPILRLFIQKIKENQKSVSTLNKLKNTAIGAWEKVMKKEDIDIEKVARQLQNKIYQNRIDSPLIFEWFYKLKRKKLEEEMYYSVARLVDDYKTIG